MKCRRNLTLAVLALALSTTVVFAETGKPKTRDYIYACKNDWQQSVEVRVSAESEPQARQRLKTEDEYRSNFDMCSFRSDEPTKRHHSHADTPTE